MDGATVKSKPSSRRRAQEWLCHDALGFPGAAGMIRSHLRY
jgi:hypothetical protein